MKCRTSLHTIAVKTRFGSFQLQKCSAAEPPPAPPSPSPHPPITSFPCSAPTVNYPLDRGRLERAPLLFLRLPPGGLGYSFYSAHLGHQNQQQEVQSVHKELWKWNDARLAAQGQMQSLQRMRPVHRTSFPTLIFLSGTPSRILQL